MTGLVMKALSGFYYVDCGGVTYTCRARGKLRYDKVSPLVGDRVEITPTGEQEGRLDAILERKNCFQRPAVANMDCLVMIAANVNPVTDPFLIDRVAALAELRDCEPLIVLNKGDLDACDALYERYTRAGFSVVRCSAVTGEGVEELRRLIAGKVCVFTGNSGVGKSSLLNALAPELCLPTGEVSEKLGRGRHTTRHVELFRLSNGAMIADTPGFASFDADSGPLLDKELLAHGFREFAPYLGQCRYVGCLHEKEKGCAVLAAVKEGKISRGRHESYVRLLRAAREHKSWEDV